MVRASFSVRLQVIGRQQCDIPHMKAGELGIGVCRRRARPPSSHDSVLSLGNDSRYCCGLQEEYGIPERRVYWTLGKQRQILVLTPKSSAIFTSAAKDRATIFFIM